MCSDVLCGRKSPKHLCVVLQRMAKIENLSARFVFGLPRLGRLSAGGHEKRGEKQNGGSKMPKEQLLCTR